ncbi:MAG: AAA family ATPase [Bacteroidota bacterium]
MYKRRQFGLLKKRLEERRRFIQVLSGPRQCGKTTLARQVAGALRYPVRSISADDPASLGGAWLLQQWDIARIRGREGGRRGALLVIDEVQKVENWAETVKRLWDEDTAFRMPLRVLVLGSAALLVQKGLTESLAGRFELVRLSHWSFDEMREAFDWPIDRYIYYGGYPGAAGLVKDQERWRSYIRDAMIETTVSRDILHLTRVDKPALLRRLFQLGCAYSGRNLSYQKMLSQLQGAGNTTTLAHYLELLEAAGLLAGLQKYAGQQARQRGSSPKLVALNTALLSAQLPQRFEEMKSDRSAWGQLVESAVGAHIVNGAALAGLRVFYWRERGEEVDFVVQRGKALTAIEVKSGAVREALPGMEAFVRAFKPVRTLVIGPDGIPVEEFLSTPLEKWVA